MPNKTVSALLLALAVSLAVAIVAVLGTTLLSSTGAEGAGIGAYASGISEVFLNGLLVVLAVVFIVAFLTFRKAGRR